LTSAVITHIRKPFETHFEEEPAGRDVMIDDNPARGQLSEFQRIFIRKREMYQERVFGIERVFDRRIQNPGDRHEACGARYLLIAAAKKGL
jgi:hypothetical protein